MNNPRRQQALEFFIRQGWTLAQAAGIVANLEAESGLRPEAVGDGGMARGIAQWHPDRQAGFEALLGKPFTGSSFEDQLYWVHAELRSTEKAAGTALAACTTAAEAGACVSRRYERPADREGEATKRAALAERILQEWTAQDHAGEPIPVAPIPASPEPAPRVPAPDLSPPRTEKPMPALALLGMFAQFLGPLIPQIGPLLNPGSKAAKFAPIAQVVVDTIVRTAGAENMQAAVEKMQSDPAVKLAVQQAVVTHPEVLGLVEIGGGIEAARASNLAIQNADRPFWYNPVFWMSIILLPMAYWIVGAVLVGGIELKPEDSQFWKIFGTSFNAETRSGVVNLVLGMVLGGIVGIWFGTSYGSMRKTELTAAKEQTNG